MLSQLFVRVICQTFVSSSKYTNTAMHEDTGEKKLIFMWKIGLVNLKPSKKKNEHTQIQSEISPQQ